MTSVMAVGWNGFGQLGVGDLEFRQDAVRVELGAADRVVGLAAGGCHFQGFSFAVTESGTVLAWGDNSFGQLHLNGRKVCPTPTQVPLDVGEQVLMVACGTRHSIIVLKNGTVKSAGDDSFGQLPRNVPLSHRIISAACGDTHSLLLTDQGLVLGFGNEKMGQLAVVGMNNVAAIACGQAHSLVLTVDGKVLGCGANTHGQLGVPGADHLVLSSPLLVSGLPSRATAIAAGTFHSLALCEDSICYGWGSNEMGQLGIEDSQVVIAKAPVPVSRERVSRVCAGGLHSILLLSQEMPGQVACFGCKSEQQCNFSGQANLVAASETHSLFSH